ncbi:DUF6783 domain-containing protein [Ruminococcus sp. RTP21358st1_A5_RTP21358_211008]
MRITVKARACLKRLSAKWSVQIAGMIFLTGSHVTKAKGGQNERSVT